MTRKRKLALIASSLAAIGGLVYGHADVQHWLAVHIGLTGHGQDPWYLFWSGPAGEVRDLIEVPALGFLFWWHHTCHQQRCFRWGHKVDGTPYRACHVHNEDHEGDSRNVVDLGSAIARARARLSLSPDQEANA